MKPIDISPPDLETVRGILRTYVPDLAVRAFGSRVSWTARESSDLDLALMTTRPLSLDLVADLKLAFAESVLPFRVDVVDWASISRRFRGIIEQDCVIIIDSVPHDITSIGMPYRPNFPTHWSRVSLYSLATWVAVEALNDACYSDEELPVRRASETKSGPSRQTKHTKQTLGETVRLCSEELLFVRMAESETSIGLVMWCDPESWPSRHMFRVTPTLSVDKDFLYYLLKFLHPAFVNIARYRRDQGIHCVTISDIKDMEVAIPKLCEQRAISRIIRPFDDKIDINRQMTKTIDSIARTAINSRLIEFDPISVDLHFRGTSDLGRVMESYHDQGVPLDPSNVPLDWKGKFLSDDLSSVREYESAYLRFLHNAMHHQNIRSLGAGASSSRLNHSRVEMGNQITHIEDSFIELNQHIIPLVAFIKCLESESNALQSISNLLLNKLMSS